MLEHRRLPLDGSALGAALATERLRLEPLCAHHAPLLFAGMCEPTVYEWISIGPPSDAAVLAARWTRLERARAADDGAIGAPRRALIDLGWAVQRAEDGAWIGKLDAEISDEGVATNVGYLFFPGFWRRGYASEAVAALCAHLARAGVTEQRATVTLGNEASCRVLERAGFVRTRVLRGNDRVQGVVVDDIEFIRRDDAR